MPVNFSPITDTSSAFQLIPLRFEDIFLIKDWRNSQIDVLRQSKRLSDDDQLKYYNEVALPSFSQSEPAQLLYSFLENNICIGYGGLVHISWINKHAEVSFLLNPIFTRDPLEYENYFRVYLNILKEFARKNLGFHKLTTEVYDIRPHHLSVLEKNGFIFQGRLKDHVIINNRFVDSVLHAHFLDNTDN